MKIKLNDTVQYEVASARMVDGKIIALRDGGEEITIGGDLSTVTVEGGVIVKETEPTQLDMIEAQVTYTAMMTDTLLEV